MKALLISVAGHLPLLQLAGGQRPDDAAWQEILYPVGNRLITRCDAVLRLPGESTGADKPIRLATERGLATYCRLEDEPGCDPSMALVS